MIARGLVLFVRGIVFLVDNDEPKIADRSENRASGPHHHASLPRPDPVPLVIPFAIGQRRMQHGDLVAETSREPTDRLRGQRNLRHENNRTTPLIQCTSNRLKIDFRLSTPRDAMEQNRFRRRIDDVKRPSLLLVQLQWGRRHHAPTRKWVAPEDPRGNRNRTPLRQRPKRGGRCLELTDKLLHPATPYAPQLGQQLCLMLRQTLTSDVGHGLHIEKFLRLDGGLENRRRQCGLQSSLNG